jgi:hypothetical protein
MCRYSWSPSSNSDKSFHLIARIKLWYICWCCIEYTSPWTGFELTTLVVIDTDCTGSCKSKYHTITTTTTSNVLILLGTGIGDRSFNLFVSLHPEQTKIDYFYLWHEKSVNRSYGIWIYNYLCNQCLSPLKLWARNPFMARCTRYNIMR